MQIRLVELTDEIKKMIIDKDYLYLAYTSKDNYTDDDGNPAPDAEECLMSELGWYHIAIYRDDQLIGIMEYEENGWIDPHYFNMIDMNPQEYVIIARKIFENINVSYIETDDNESYEWAMEWTGYDSADWFNNRGVVTRKIQLPHTQLPVIIKYLE